jgi:hypothetical protein
MTQGLFPRRENLALDRRWPAWPSRDQSTEEMETSVDVANGEKAFWLIVSKLVVAQALR